MLPVGPTSPKAPAAKISDIASPEVNQSPAPQNTARPQDIFQADAPQSSAPVQSVPETPPEPVDGRAWAQDAVEDIRARVANGEKVRVVFDLDNTIWDNRPRTLELGRRFDAEHGSHLFEGLRLDQVGKDGYETAINAGLSREQAREFSSYYRKYAYADEMNQYDAPLAETVALARQAHDAGAEVVYLTARPEEERAGTLGNLERMGLPDSDSAHLIMKPTPKEPSAPYKVRELTRMQEAGDAHLSWFMTESRRDVGAVQDAKLEVPTVLIDAPWEHGGRPVDPSTPIYPSDVYRPAPETPPEEPTGWPSDWPTDWPSDPDWPAVDPVLWWVA